MVDVGRRGFATSKKTIKPSQQKIRRKDDTAGSVPQIEAEIQEVMKTGVMECRACERIGGWAGRACCPEGVTSADTPPLLHPSPKLRCVFELLNRLVVTGRFENW